jgi:hypothetical protein
VETRIDKIKCWYVILVTFILHLVLINLNPVNFEFTFSEGTKYLINFDKQIVEDYFFDQANTFFYSLIAGLANKIFPLENTLIYTRVFSASSYFLLGLAFINLFSYFKIKLKCHYFLIFFFSNPMIWTYGHRGIPDLFSSSLALYSFSRILILRNNINFKIYFNYFLLGISICIKPFSLIYLGLIILLDYEDDIFFIIKKYFLLTIITLFLPIVYFIIIKINFNFYLVPPRFSHMITFLHGNVLSILLGYFTFISIVVFPATFNFNFFREKKNIILFVFFSALILFIYYLYPKPIAELNFGFLQKLMDLYLINIFILFFVSLFFLYLKNLIKNKVNYKLIFIIFLYIIILSFTRPSQRYLINILPIVFLLILLNLKELKIEFFSLIILIIYVPINLLIATNFYFVSNNNKKVIYFLIDEKIINKTMPGALYPHSKAFFNNSNKKEYEVSFTPGKVVIKQFDFNNIIQKQSYYINKL